MSDMFDTYNRVRANGLKQSLHQNAAEAQQIIIDKNKKISELEADVWVWAAAASAKDDALNAALELLDEKCGGADNNPLRQESGTKVVIPSGDRDGENIQERDRIFLVSFKRIVEKNCPHIGSWKQLIRKYSLIW